METYHLAELSITYNEITTRLAFTAAQLVVVTETGFKLWYIEIDGMTQTSLLHMFNESEHIGVEIAGITAGGKPFKAYGYFHPNVQHHAAAIRGDGELAGF
ncbi:hypothetical protein A8990_11327 [Paenibacillus taihuensis]|uniref:Uncharacterized protein n=1 Tax=Paenibacillus taihuensis TaxID=1156355 RepID=A0A3D9RYN4_9BACL|nr:hypothetical protein [Paenibacillus taihuensis]REE85110.1 hypothetical protein A8990_11327 [Paenibacillus taihuensis]